MLYLQDHGGEDDGQDEGAATRIWGELFRDKRATAAYMREVEYNSTSEEEDADEGPLEIAGAVDLEDSEEEMEEDL